jgi:hypothetical protein
MKHVRTAIFLLLCLGLGYGLAQGYLYWRRHTGHSFASSFDTLVTGQGDAPGLRGFTLRDPVREDVNALCSQWREMWATAVGIEYSSAWTREAFLATAAAARGHGLAVVVLPPPAYGGGNPFPRPLGEVAADAQAAKADAVCIAWLDTDPDPAYWKKEAAAVRAAYSGKLILAATAAVMPAVACWDVADYVGVAGPIPLPRRLPHASDDVAFHDLRVAWDSQLTTLESIAMNHGRKAALLNVAVPANYWFKLPLPGRPEPTYPVNRGLQSTVYEAMLTETKGRAERSGILLMPWAVGGVPAEGANLVPGLLPKIAAAWDPKKPRAAEAPPK